jgi:hypothetical protein
MRIIVLFLCLTCQFCLAGPVTEPKFIGDWSETTNGLRGRLLFAERSPEKWEIQNNSRSGVVFLELQNIASADTLYVYYDEVRSPLHCELRDSVGNVIPLGGVFVNSDLRPAPCWLALPNNSTLRFSTTVFVNSPKNSLLISVGEAMDGGAWKIPLDSTNDYYLSGTFNPTPPENETRPHVWEGTLKLPPVKISVRQIQK